MAPEVKKCKKIKLDSNYDLMRSDIYSLGITFLEILNTFHFKFEILDELISGMICDVPEKRPEINFCYEKLLKIEECEINRKIVQYSTAEILNLCLLVNAEKIEKLLSNEDGKKIVNLICSNYYEFKYSHDLKIIAEKALNQEKSINKSNNIGSIEI